MLKELSIEMGKISKAGLISNACYRFPGFCQLATAIVNSQFIEEFIVGLSSVAFKLPAECRLAHMTDFKQVIKANVLIEST